uniref:Protein GUCD1 n=1 Tax=Macrostomum lignano TaxID=282301 RepID=A0A1I8F2C5_9PLAT
PDFNDLHVNNKDYIDGNKEAEYLALINRGAVLLSRYPLVPQSANHDCGIACLRMVLRGLDVPQAENLLAEAMEASDLGESVWTPDLLRITAALRASGSTPLCSNLYPLALCWITCPPGWDPVICLIDANNTDAARLRSCMHCNCLSLSSPCCGGGPYQGHYILLCGYLPEERRLIYRDPMSRISEYKLMSFKEFDRVRTAYGTDEDLLFVFG